MKLLKSLVFAAAAAIAALPAMAAYPDKVISFVVPFPPGAPVDGLARYVAAAVEKELGQSVIVENKPGAGGSTGSAFVARAKPDGYSVLLATASPMVIAPSVRSDYPFDTLKAFTPIVGINTDGTVILVKPALKANTFKELIDLAKANPGHVSFGTSGIGTAPHFAAELLMAATGIQMVHVPYPGGPAGLRDLEAGNLDVMFNPTQDAANAVRIGKARALAVVADRRVAGLPNVPTVVELGISQMAVTQGWSGFFVPAGTPKDVVTKLQAALQKVMSTEGFKSREAALGLVGSPMVGDEFKNRIVNDQAAFVKIARERNIAVRN